MSHFLLYKCEKCANILEIGASYEYGQKLKKKT